jgi:hypothetical protein
MDKKPNSNSNINIKWTKYGKSRVNNGLHNGLMLDLLLIRTTLLFFLIRTTHHRRLLFLIRINNSQLNSPLPLRRDQYSSTPTRSHDSSSPTRRRVQQPDCSLSLSLSPCIGALSCSLRRRRSQHSPIWLSLLEFF